MRITSVQVAPVARIAAIIYALLGLIAFLAFAAGSAQYLTLPFGFIAPLFHLNLNLNLGRSNSVIYNFFMCQAAILSYSASGWLTGAMKPWPLISSPGASAELMRNGSPQQIKLKS
jgi:hypothetical protein